MTRHFGHQQPPVKCWWVSWQIEQGRPLLWSLPFSDFSASFGSGTMLVDYAGAGVMAHRRQALPVGQHVSTRSPRPRPQVQAEISPAQGGGASGKQEAPSGGRRRPRPLPGQVCAWDRTVLVGAGPGGSRSGGQRALEVGSMTALQLKELSQSGLYRRRRDRPDSLRLPGLRRRHSGEWSRGDGDKQPGAPRASLVLESATGNGRAGDGGHMHPFGF